MEENMAFRIFMAVTLSVLLVLFISACGGGGGGSGGASDKDAPASPDAGNVGDSDTVINNGDRYETAGTNPFVYAAHDPYATFAADVDTASYDIFRRDVEDGLLPDPASVRLEEYVNYFQYQYAMPEEGDEHPFTVSLTGAPGGGGFESTLLRVGLQGRVVPESDREAANLVFLVDVSGSMGMDDKLPLVKYLLTRALDHLDAEDKISIVTYASGTEVLLSPTAVEERVVIEDAVESLDAGGSTAGASGIELAYEQAEAGFLEGGVNHVLLCTDGDFNVGPSSDEALVELIEEKRETGITLTALGFGSGNLNDSMMEAITNAGNGTYAVISSRAQADHYAQYGLLNGLYYIAKDVKLQVEFNPQHVLAYRLLGYENRNIADDDFTNDDVDAGEIGSGHQVTALFELVFPGDQIPAPEGAPQPQDGEPVDGTPEIAADELALVKVRYKEIEAGTEALDREVRLSIKPEQILDSAVEADADFRWSAAIAAFAEILKASPFAKSDAISSIEEVIMADDGSTLDREEFISLFVTAKTLLEAQNQ
jgi:Ca-activated chloride channel family protein